MTKHFQYARARELFGETNRGQAAYPHTSARNGYRRLTDEASPSYGIRSLWPGVALLFVLTPRKSLVTAQVQTDERLPLSQEVFVQAESDSTEDSNLLSDATNAPAC
jgi:hypothetical protein